MALELEVTQSWKTVAASKLDETLLLGNTEAKRTGEKLDGETKSTLRDRKWSLSAPARWAPPPYLGGLRGEFAGAQHLGHNRTTEQSKWNSAPVLRSSLL